MNTPDSWQTNDPDQLRMILQNQRDLLKTQGQLLEELVLKSLTQSQAIRGLCGILDYVEEVLKSNDLELDKQQLSAIFEQSGTCSYKDLYNDLYGQNQPDATDEVDEEEFDEEDNDRVVDLRDWPSFDRKWVWRDA